MVGSGIGKRKGSALVQCTSRPVCDLDHRRPGNRHYALIPGDCARDPNTIGTVGYTVRLFGLLF